MRWLPHLCLLGVASLMLLVAQLKHLPTEEALRVAFDVQATTDDRIWAAHLAANRATEPDIRLGQTLVSTFLDAEDERLREAAVLIDLCRHAQRPASAPPGSSPPLQDAYAYGALTPEGWTPHRYRTLLFHRRKVGGSYVGGVRRMDLVEATWLIDAIRGAPLAPTEEIAAYMTKRAVAPAAYQPRNRPR